MRSSEDWSSGILDEHSIQNVYCETIRNAQHFRYTESQFIGTAIPSLRAKVAYQYLSTLEHAFAVRVDEGFGREECGRVLLQDSNSLS